MRAAMLALVLTMTAACAAQAAATPPPQPWHADWKSTVGDVKAVVVDLGTMVVTVLGIALVTVNGRRIWSAAKNAALTINIPFVGNISLPARAAAELQAHQPPADTGLLPPKSGPIGRGTPPSHLLAAADSIVNATASLSSVASGQRAAALATHLLGDPATLAGMTVYSPAEVAFYRQFYAALFASQFDLLDSLNAPGAVTVDDARSLYQANRAFGQPLSFAEWLDYPRKYGMIDAVDVRNPRAALHITERGRDFLDWAATEGYGSGNLKATGRSA